MSGTRRALYESGRDSITITFESLTPATVGALIALYERAVGLYAELIDINAYHQPGVQAGKKAADEVLALQKQVVTYLKDSGAAATAEEVAAAVAQPDEVEGVFKILEYLSACPGRGVSMEPDEQPGRARFTARD